MTKEEFYSLKEGDIVFSTESLLFYEYIGDCSNNASILSNFECISGLSSMTLTIDKAIVSSRPDEVSDLVLVDLSTIVKRWLTEKGYKGDQKEMSKYNVGDKFVIEIDKVFDTDSEGKSIYKIKGFDSLVMTDFGLDKLKESEQNNDMVPPYNKGDILEVEGCLYYYNGYELPNEQYLKKDKSTLFLVNCKGSVGNEDKLGRPLYDALGSYPSDFVKLIQRS